MTQHYIVEMYSLMIEIARHMFRKLNFHPLWPYFETPLHLHTYI
jgi:hypothetical protein